MHNMIRRKCWIASWCCCILFIGCAAPLFASAADFSTLKGFWQCQEEEARSTLEFESADTLRYNGEPAAYRLSGNVLSVQEEYSTTDYYVELQEGTLLILSPEGYVTYCQKGVKPRQAQPAPSPPAAPQSSPPQYAHGWPPPYARPPGNISWQSSEPQALLYKFAGRWDHVTRNTLTNLFLKPNGTYEEAYEAGYSGSFTDPGGYQSGNWGAAGSEQASGTWYAEGTLERGRITLTDRQGRQRVYNYQVHVERGEYFGGEYYFNGDLYSVNYIYR